MRKNRVSKEAKEKRKKLPPCAPVRLQAWSHPCRAGVERTAGEGTAILRRIQAEAFPPQLCAGRGWRGIWRFNRLKSGDCWLPPSPAPPPPR